MKEIPNAARAEPLGAAQERAAVILRMAMMCGLGVLALSPLVVSTQTLFPFGFGKGIAIRLTAAVLAMLWAALVFLERRKALRFTAIDGALVACIVVALVSTLVSVDRYRSLVGDVERMAGLLALLAYGTVYLAARAAFEERRYWVWFAKAAVAAGMLQSAYAIAQASGADFVWVPDARPGGAFGNAAMLAGYMLFILALGAIVVIESPRRGWRIYGGVACLLAVVTIELSGTRGALLGVYGGLLVAAIAARVSFSSSRIRTCAAIVTLALVATPAIVATPVASWAADRHSSAVGRFARISWNDPTTQVRLDLARIAWRAFRDKPVAGWGLDTFRVPFNRYFDAQWLEFSPQETFADNPHNKVLEVAVESGIIGVVGYLGVLVAVATALGSALRAAQGDHERWILVVLLAMWTAYFVNDLFFFDSPVSYVLAAVGLAGTDRLASRTAGATRAGDSRLRGAIALAVVVFAVGTMEYNLRAWHACVRGRMAAGLASPASVVAEMDGALRAETYVAELLRRLLAGPVLERLQVNAAEDPAAFATLVRAAAGQLEEGIRRDKLDARLPTRLGELYNLLGSQHPAYYRRAEDALRSALALSPNRPSLHFALAYSYRGQGRPNEAMRAEDAGKALMQRVTSLR